MWWPATVENIQAEQSGIWSNQFRQGVLMYHKHGKYGAERAHVVFMASTEGRYVRSIDTDMQSIYTESVNYSSWLYADEKSNDDKKLHESNTTLVEDGRQTVNASTKIKNTLTRNKELRPSSSYVPKTRGVGKRPLSKHGRVKSFSKPLANKGDDVEDSSQFRRNHEEIPDRDSNICLLYTSPSPRDA